MPPQIITFNRRCVRPFEADLSHLLYANSRLFCYPPITTEHSSLKIKLFHSLGAQLSLSFAHLNGFYMFSDLIITFVLKAHLPYHIDFSSLHTVALPTFVGL